MSVIIRRFMDRLFAHNNPYTVSIVGVSGGGKTTLLYQLKLRQVVTAYPTLGFNVETVEVPTSSGKPLKFTGWDLGIGCASMHTMTRLHATYVANGHALIWVVDANERGYLDESVKGLIYMLQCVDNLLKTEDRRRRFPLLMYVWPFFQSPTYPFFGI